MQNFKFSLHCAKHCFPNNDLCLQHPMLSSIYSVQNTILGGPAPFLPMEKCVFSHFSPQGKMGKKGKVFISLSFHILFSHFSMGKNGVGPAPPPLYCNNSWNLHMTFSITAIHSNCISSCFSKVSISISRMTALSCGVLTHRLLLA